MNVIDPSKPKLTKTDLRKIKLAAGGHEDRTNGLCVMEVAAWLAALMQHGGKRDAELQREVVEESDA